MLLVIIRIIFVMLSILGGLIFSTKISFNPLTGVLAPLTGIAIGLLIAGFSLLAEYILKRRSSEELFILAAGTIIGWFFTFISWNVISHWSIEAGTRPFILFGLALVFIYLSISILLTRKEEFPWLSAMLKKERDPKGSRKVLDSSVIIDGRIADIMEAGFLEGELLIPRFILQEVQRIADSQDHLKRARGRRGLEVLNKIQQNSGKNVEIYEKDFPEIKTVDEKLVEAGRVLNAKIVTNDYNLNKVAKLQGVAILNINDLAGAVKPVVMPGELMTVRVLKEGKEPDQGVAYLDDGTMIVIDGGKNHIGQTIEVAVTTIHQTTAGRMIFTKIEG